MPQCPICGTPVFDIAQMGVETETLVSHSCLAALLGVKDPTVETPPEIAAQVAAQVGGEDLVREAEDFLRSQ